jgi:hypothetical protein
MKSPMKTILAGSLIVLSTAMPLTALAAPPKAHTTQRHDDATTGAITSITAQEVKLASGDTFKLKPGVSAANFKAGDKVKVQWTMKDGAKLADKISAVKN